MPAPSIFLDRSAVWERFVNALTYRLQVVSEPLNQMPEPVLLCPVSPGEFSDELLSEMIRVMALRGDSPIAQLARIIRDLRKVEIPLESAISRQGRESYDRLLCCDLYFEMLREGAIRGDRLNLDKLRRCVRLPSVDRAEKMLRERANSTEAVGARDFPPMA